MIDTAPYIERIQVCTTKQELEDIELELFGRKQGVMTTAMKSLKDVSADERKAQGQELNKKKQALAEAIASKQQELLQPSDDVLAEKDPIDVTLNLPEQERGHLHPIPEFIRQVEEVFGRMGFDTAYGPEIESEEFNFNLLNIPEDHPARDGQDTFWINEDGDSMQRTVLRTHTSPVQIRYMKENKPPFRMICPGKVYRKDADATHSPMFHQFEGLMIGKHITLSNMKAVMGTAIRELIGNENLEFRFRTGFFPFVEPGLEIDMRWQGDDADSREGKWLEIAGCGMVHPNVLRNCDIDPEEWQGFAFGFGVERMIMIKHQIPDLRSFYIGDLRFLKQF